MSPQPENKFADKARALWTQAHTQKALGDKAYLIHPAEAPDLLRVMGILNNDASMSADNVRKFQQINHMVGLIVPQLRDLCSRHKVVYVLDACCGSSFMALAIAWLLHVKWQHECRVVGIDRNEAVINKSRERAQTLGWGAFARFMKGDVTPTAWHTALAKLFPDAATGDKPARPHLLCALHACDTATDHALALGIASGADYMAVAPCCQAELAQAWEKVKTPHALHPLFTTPNLRRDAAATFTDTLRMLLVRSRGYEVTATEFVPSQHTPKNRLLLCTKRGKFHEESATQLAALKAELQGCTITLDQLLEGALT